MNYGKHDTRTPKIKTEEKGNTFMMKKKKKKYNNEKLNDFLLLPAQIGSKNVSVRSLSTHRENTHLNIKLCSVCVCVCVLLINNYFVVAVVFLVCCTFQFNFHKSLALLYNIPSFFNCLPISGLFYLSLSLSLSLLPPSFVTQIVRY